MTAALLQALRDAVGADQVLSEGDLSAYELDWRKRFRGRALAVVRPADTAQVAAVLRACAAHGASVVPQWAAAVAAGGCGRHLGMRRALLTHTLQSCRQSRKIVGFWQYVEALALGLLCAIGVATRQQNG